MSHIPALSVGGDDGKVLLLLLANYLGGKSPFGVFVLDLYSLWVEFL